MLKMVNVTSLLNLVRLAQWEQVGHKIHTYYYKQLMKIKTVVPV